MGIQLQITSEFWKKCHFKGQMAPLINLSVENITTRHELSRFTIYSNKNVVRTVYEFK